MTAPFVSRSQRFAPERNCLPAGGVRVQRSGRRSPDVDVWFASVSAFTPWLANFASVLSREERARADAFRAQHLRTAYIVRHGLLRMVLGRQSSTHAADVQFEYTPRGKPFSPGASQFFSASHSGDLVMFAVGHTPCLGIDVEQIRAIPEVDELVLRHFTAREYRSLLAMSPPDRERGFLACWTAKEAILKATGEGIYGGLAQVEVTASRPASILRIESENAAAWRLRSFMPRSGYVAAVAVKQAELRLRCHGLELEPASLFALRAQ